MMSYPGRYTSDLAHEVLPVYLGCSVALQLDPGSRRQQLLRVDFPAYLVIGPLDPIPSKLGQ